MDDSTEHPKVAHSTRDSTTKDATFSGAQDAVAHACHLFYSSIDVVLQRLGDKNILPFAHVVLAFLNSMAYVPQALLYVEGQVPWESIVTFLNTLGRSGVVESRFEGSAFPQPLSGTGRQLPEDFIMRGLVWAKHYFPSGFFEGQVVDEDERTLELPSHVAPRAERCLWLGVQLATVSLCCSVRLLDVYTDDVFSWSGGSHTTRKPSSFLRPTLRRVSNHIEHIRSTVDLLPCRWSAKTPL